jgi:prepilin-type N-terminal cleavage/methylation domain-containing protein
MQDKLVLIKQGGYTFTEIMIVVAIMGIVAAIAVPNFLKSRKRSHMNTCIANLKQIDSAKEQAAFVDPELTDITRIFGPSGYIKVTPVCPLTKMSYSVGANSGFPVCPNASADSAFPHVLPPPDL